MKSYCGRCWSILALALTVGCFGLSLGFSQNVEEEAEREFRYREAMALLSAGEDGAEKAAKELKELAVAGHARSQYWLGQLYLQGLGLARNEDQGTRWIERSAEAGYPMASLALAELLLGKARGEGAEEPDYEAIRAHLEAVVGPEASGRVAPEEFGLFRTAKSRAGYLLGSLYQNGWGVEKDMAAAIRYFLDASRTGDKEASMALAIAYAKGEEVERDVEKAKTYFELFDLQSTDALNRSIEATYGESGDEGDAQNLIEASRYVDEAVTHLVYAVQTEFAREVLDDTSEAFDAEFAATLLRLASEGGYAEAKVWLGMLHYRGLGVEQDMAEAARLFTEAAGDDWVLAKYNLALMIRAGESPAPEGLAAELLLEEAASFGLYAAQVALDGEEGVGLLTPVEALALCQRKAEEGDARALYSLAVRKATGWMVEVEVDFSEIASLYRQSAEKGYARAEYMLGMMLITGEGMAPRPAVGMTWLRSAAYQGLPEAIYGLGECYVKGIGVEPNPQDALHYFRRAAELGVENAKNRLAAFHFYGILVPKNEYKAAELYLEAADKGDAEAAANLAMCYLRGVGASMSTEQGIRWLARSAELGNVMACYQLTTIYSENLLVDQDAVETAYWMERAAEMGDKNAMKETAFNYFLGRGQPRNRGKAANWLAAYQTHPSPTPVGNLYFPEEYESHATVQAFLPEDFSALMLSADLMAEEGWSGSDLRQARKLYERLAGKGSLGATLRLARMQAAEGPKGREARKAFSAFKGLFDEHGAETYPGKRRYASEAAYALSRCYADGIGTRPNEEQRIQWLNAAAQREHSEAQYELGVLLAGEAEGSRGREQGASWLLAAAKAGDSRSRILLAKLHLDAPLGVVEEAQIIEWLKELVDSGSGEARGLLRRFGVRYKEIERGPGDGAPEEREADPWAPVGAA